jgi:hypothetical protein
MLLQAIATPANALDPLEGSGREGDCCPPSGFQSSQHARSIAMISSATLEGHHRPGTSRNRTRLAYSE